MADDDEKKWLAKNWAWAVPVGLLVLIGAGVVLFGPPLFGNAAAIRKTDAYREAVRRITRNARVRKELGDPVEADSGIEGNLQVRGKRGYANFSIPVSGSKRKGTIYVEASLMSGTWRFDHLAVEVEGSSKQIVLEGHQPAPRRPTTIEAPQPGLSSEGQLPDIPSGNSPPVDPTPESAEPESPETASPDNESASAP